MRSDIVKLTGSQNDIERALKQAEGVAGYYQLARKNAIHLRLLAEETMNMVRTLTGTRTALFWIEDDEKQDDRTIRLHLRVETNMTTELRKSLLSASTSGKNTAAKGFSGKLRDLFERACEPEDQYVADYYAAGWVYSDVGMGTLGVDPGNIWSFNRYKDSLDAASGDQSDEKAELEQSIIGNLAGEVQVSIKGGTVEMIIYSKDKPAAD